jgi:hypothetical protein
MIVELFIYAIGVILGFFGSFFPSDPSCGCVTSLPWGIDSILTQGVNGYKILAESFPPFGIIFTAFLILLGFKIALKLLKGVPLLGRTLE